jgi:ABC-type glycerol-3-phosphate transport system permease component
MAAKDMNAPRTKLSSSLVVNGVLILICLLWLVPTLGVLITSSRQPGYLQERLVDRLPHKEDVQSGEIQVTCPWMNGPTRSPMSPILLKSGVATMPDGKHA